MENIFKSLKQVINFAAHRLYPVSRRVVSANLILKNWDRLPAFNQKNSHRILPLIKRFEGLTMHPCHFLEPQASNPPQDLLTGLTWETEKPRASG